MDIGVGLWLVAIRLPDEYLSRDNLERLFRYYSRKHPDSDGRLHVDVSSDTTFERIIENGEAQWWGKPYYNDGAFMREEIRTIAGGEYNEWYDYSPYLDRENHDIRKTVVLRGTHPCGLRRVIESWEVSRGDLSIAVFEYKFRGIEPQGVYYSFEVPDGMIMTVREEDKRAIPRDQVRFLDDQNAYVFMGCKFAGTSDGGRTWSVWDAERELPNGQNCAPIQDVQIGLDGIGTMRLKTPLEEQELSTSDFGRHWTTIK
jgi:hypothetical protein